MTGTRQHFPVSSRTPGSLNLMPKSPPTVFEDGPSQPMLRPGEVHLWRVCLSSAPAGIGDSLAPEERARANRFHFEKDRARFVAGRGLVRSILGRYLGLPPANVRFQTGPHGKPSLEDSHIPLCFNLSHSGEVLLVAVAHGREIGVDVELMRDDVPFEMLAERYFEPADACSLRTLSTSDKAWRFYDIWTSTEARLKASGLGLSQGTKVSEPHRWSLRTLTPADGYAAALAVEGEDFELECWSWPN